MTFIKIHNISANTITYKYSIKIFHIREVNELIYARTRTNPHFELVGYVTMSISSSISTGFRHDSYSTSSLNPCLNRKHKVITTRRISNCIEFGTIHFIYFSTFSCPRTCIIKTYLYLCRNRTRLHPIRTARGSFFLYRIHESETKNYTRAIVPT